MANGHIQGTYTLPGPIIAGDHFRATIGFIKCGSGVLEGDCTFTVSMIMPNGAIAEAASVSDAARDNLMKNIDVDLTPYIGATRIRNQVTRNGDIHQPWATWVAPRIEP